MSRTRRDDAVEPKESPFVAQSHLRKVKKARQRRDTAEHAFHAAIVAAHESGETYRDIGIWAGLSHQRVQEIVKAWKKPS